MIGRDELAGIIARHLLPKQPDLIYQEALGIADVVLTEYTLVKLPESTSVDEFGVTWYAADGHPIVTVVNADLVAGDDLLSADEGEEEGRALLAAVRAARAFLGLQS